MAVCEVCGRPVGSKYLREIDETFWEEYLICENCIEAYKAEQDIRLAYGK